MRGIHYMTPGFFKEVKEDQGFLFRMFCCGATLERAQRFRGNSGRPARTS